MQIQSDLGCFEDIRESQKKDGGGLWKPENQENRFFPTAFRKIKKNTVIV